MARRAVEGEEFDAAHVHAVVDELDHVLDLLLGRVAVQDLGVGQRVEELLLVLLPDDGVARHGVALPVDRRLGALARQELLGDLRRRILPVLPLHEVLGVVALWELGVGRVVGPPEDGPEAPVRRVRRDHPGVLPRLGRPVHAVLVDPRPLRVHKLLLLLLDHARRDAVVHVVQILVGELLLELGDLLRRVLLRQGHLLLGRHLLEGLQIKVRHGRGGRRRGTPSRNDGGAADTAEAGVRRGVRRATGLQRTAGKGDSTTSAISGSTGAGRRGVAAFTIEAAGGASSSLV